MWQVPRREVASHLPSSPLVCDRYRPGDALSELPAWLGDSAGMHGGMWYLFAIIVLQLIMAVVSGSAPPQA